MIPTALTEKETYELGGLASNKRVLEVGSLLGHSTIAMAKVAQVVHSVDPHEGYPFNRPRPTLVSFLENLEEAGVREDVVVHVGYDFQVLPALQARQFDLVFLDMTGLYSDTRRAMESSVRLLRYYGRLAVHDCGHEEWPGVERAVKDFALQYNTTYRKVDSTAIFEQTWPDHHIFGWPTRRPDGQADRELHLRAA